MRRAAALSGAVIAALALAAPGPQPEVLASRSVTQVARTPSGAPAGEVRATVELIRWQGEVQSRVTFRSSLQGPAVANGMVVLTGPGQAELARSNPRQLATLQAGGEAELVSPRVTGDVRCAAALVNVWSGAQAPGADASARQGPDLLPTTFNLTVCRD